MFDLVYNIDFELVAFAFALLLYIETSICYPRRIRKNQIFHQMALIVVVTEAFDILSAFTITYGSRIPNFVNVIVNSGYFMSGLLLCYVLHYYIQNAVVPPEGRRLLIRTNRIILIAMEISFLPNAFFGQYFYFSAAGVYTHGPLYLLSHLVSLWFVLCASASLVVNCRRLKRAQIVSSFLFVLLYFVAVILQTFVFTDVLLIMPAVSAMLIIAIFSLESPDYVQLQTTLQELTETKRELERANAKYYALAYTDLMTGLENRAAYNIRLEQLNREAVGSRLIVMMADVNNLKQLNDRYGHMVGDEAIVRAARLLKGNFRDGCQCYRIGGDEFAVIAYDLSEADFMAAYHRFMGEVEAENTASPYPFSVATGYRKVDHLSLSEALKKADERMYRNKAAGKQGSQSGA